MTSRSQSRSISAARRKSRCGKRPDLSIDQLATPNELYRRPGSSFAASFVGDANILHCETGATASTLIWKGQQFACEMDGRVGVLDRVRVMVRPEDVLVSPDGQGIAARVNASSFHGFYWMHELDLDGDILLAREICEKPSVEPGQTARVTVDFQRAAVLPD